MTEGTIILLWQQRQEYLAQQAFEKKESCEVKAIENYYAEDAIITEEERWEELCQQQNSQQSS